MAQAILQQLDKVVSPVGDLTVQEKDYLKQYQQTISQSCHYYLAQIDEVKDVEL